MRKAFPAAVLAMLASGWLIAAEPPSLPVTVHKEAGPPKVGTKAVAVELATVGAICRHSLTKKEVPSADATQLEQLAKDLDHVTVWMIWDELPRPATEAQLRTARIELRNAGTVVGSIKPLNVRATLPLFGIDEQACAVEVVVEIGLTNSRGIDLGGGVKALTLNADAPVKAFSHPPGVYPIKRPATGPTPSPGIQDAETF